MNWKNKKVFVTGAGGFIGSHLTEKLVDLGAKVTAFVRYNSRSDSGFIKNFPDKIRENLKISYGDVTELETVKDALNDQEIVFHLAALPGIPYSYLHPYEVFQTNAVGTLNVLSCLRDSKTIEKVIVTSTSEVYGTARYVPIDEKHPLQAQSPYSAAKIASDKIAESFFKSYNLPVVIVRPFNAYGPRQSTRAVIPTIITQALTKKTIELGDTATTRDFTLVLDTVQGFIRSAEVSEAVGETINVGSGQEISIGDLVKKIVALTNKPVKIKIDRKRLRPKKSEVQRLLADSSKARKLLSWSPKYTLDEGLTLTIDWVKKNLNDFHPEAYHV